MTDLANAPKQMGYAKIAYNVLADMDNQWLTAKELYDLMPSATKADKASWKKLKMALGNGAERGLFASMGDAHGYEPTRKFRIATRSHQKSCLKKYYKKWPTTAKKQTKGQSLNGTSDLLATIEKEIEKTEEKLARLERMRNDAKTL